MTNGRECAFQFVYEKSPEEYYLNNSVAESRIELGMALAKEITDEVKDKIDFVCPVPNTGTYYAMGLAEKLCKPYIQGITKLSKTERSFHIESTDERKKFLWSKIYIIPELVKNKNIAVVDEAIFTGATLKVVCEMLKDAGAADIYLCIPTPKCRYHCEYGVQPERQMLLEYISEGMLNEYFGVAQCFWQSDMVFKEFSLKFSNRICMECFYGRYTDDYCIGSGAKRN